MDLPITVQVDKREITKILAEHFCEKLGITERVSVLTHTQILCKGDAELKSITITLGNPTN